jgi:hypothetical protein
MKSSAAALSFGLPSRIAQAFSPPVRIAIPSWTITFADLLPEVRYVFHCFTTSSELSTNPVEVNVSHLLSEKPAQKSCLTTTLDSK